MVASVPWRGGPGHHDVGPGPGYLQQRVYSIHDDRDPRPPPFDWQDAARRLLGDDVTFLDAARHTVHGGRRRSPYSRLGMRPPRRSASPRSGRCSPACRKTPAFRARTARRATWRCWPCDRRCLHRDRRPAAQPARRFAVPGRGDIANPAARVDRSRRDAGRGGTRARSGARRDARAARAGGRRTAERAGAPRPRRRRAGRKPASGSAANAEGLVEVRRCCAAAKPVTRSPANVSTGAGEDATGHPVLIHNDIWPAWQLVDESLAAEGAARRHRLDLSVAGSPVIDLAQLSVRVAGWSEGTAESVLAPTAMVAPAAARPSGGWCRWWPRSTCRPARVACWRSPTLDDSIANDPAQPLHYRGGIKVLLRSLSS